MLPFNVVLRFNVVLCLYAMQPIYGIYGVEVWPLFDLGYSI